MTDIVYIGPVPADEECQQVGTVDYDASAARAECIRFRDLIRAKLGVEPEGARLAIKSNPHDYGSCYEVVCYYDCDSETATDYAFRCENAAPTTWGG